MSVAPNSQVSSAPAAAALAEALASHRAAFVAEPFPDAETRITRLERLADTLYARREAIARAIASDFGHRSHHETLMAEVAVSVLSIRHMVAHVAKWMAPERRGVSLVFFPGSARVMPQPLGVVGVISPWNYPVQLAVVPIATALAAGNRVMLKPSELTPATNELMAELLGNLYPSDLVSTHLGGVEVGQAFAELPFDHIVFTGSTAVGRQVMMAAARNLTPVTLELGGKSPVIVGPTADVPRAAARVAQGKLLNAGQTCIAPDYVLLPRAHRDRFVEALRARVRALYPSFVGNPDYTAIISERHRARLAHLVTDAVERGATVLPLSDEPSADGKMVPVVLLDVDDEMAVMQEEIFGPILPVSTYDHFDQAIDYVRRHPRPLAAYVFETHGPTIERVLHETHAGGVTVNDTLLHIAQDDLPFGGVGPSGIGAYHGKEGFDPLSHRKSIFQQPRVNAGFLLDPPYGRKVERLVDLLLTVLPG